MNSACTDLVRLAHISDPVFLWPSDAADCHFFYNHNMRSGASSQRHESGPAAPSRAAGESSHLRVHAAVPQLCHLRRVAHPLVLPPTSLLGWLAPCKHRPLGPLCVALDIAAPALFPPCSALTAPQPSSGGPPSSCFRSHWLCFPLLCACADVCSAPPLAACAPLRMLAPSVHIVYFQLALGWHLR